MTVDGWFRRNARRLPMMACGHMGVVQRRNTKRGVQEYPVCAHCGCLEVER